MIEVRFEIYLNYNIEFIYYLNFIIKILSYFFKYVKYFLYKCLFCEGDYCIIGMFFFYMYFIFC